MRTTLSGLAVLAAVIAGNVAGAADAAKFRYLAAIYHDTKGMGMRQPEGLACNDKATLVVGDSATGRLLRYAVEERTAKPVGELASPQLAAPIRVQLDSRDDVFALDGKARRIVRFAATGEFKGVVTPAGVPEPATIVPRSFRIDRDDRIHLLDVFGGRVLVLDADGKYQRHLPLPAGHGFISDLAIDGKGGVYVVDSVHATVYAAARGATAFTPLTKALRTYVNFPTSMAIDARGVVYLVDENGGGVVLVGQDGSVLGRQLAMGWNEGLLYYPSQICLNDKGQVFIADRGNSRVQMFVLIR